MKRTYLLFLFVFASLLWVTGQEKRNLLTSNYSMEFLKQVLQDNDSWVKYPSYEDRAAWEKFPEDLREKYIKNGERYLNFTWPVVRATEYLEFGRTGERMVMEDPQEARMRALQGLVMAELMEGKGRFMDDIVNGVFLFCEQTYWGLSACFYMYKPVTTADGKRIKPNLPNIEDPIIDLWVGEVGNDLAWVYYFFKDKFNEISPIIAKRLKYELTNRVLEPYYTRNDFWWIRGGDRGNVNNWTPWCNFNVLTCILLVENDFDKKVKGVYKTMESVDLFFNSYPDDGGCDEGPTYWGLAGGKAFEYLNLLKQATENKISLFSEPLIKEIGCYVYRAYIGNGEYFINFSDSSPKGHTRAGVVFQYGEAIEDKTLMEFGAFQLKQIEYGVEIEVATLGTLLPNLFNMDNWQQYAKEPLIQEYYFPNLQVAVARDKQGSTQGFFMAAKGGHNDESHNHNDIGSCIIYYNGQPVLVDVGVETYTKQTFSNERYKIWTMQSNYHNLPLINGTAQNPGRNFAAKDSKFTTTKSKVLFTTDIAGAYPKEAKVDKWIRSYTLNRGKNIIISDNFKLKEMSGESELHFMTPLNYDISTPGVIELYGQDFVLQMKYDSQVFSPSVEHKEITDKKLNKVWGDNMNMLILKIINNRLSQKIDIEITKK